jgi:hypothetical protein
MQLNCRSLANKNAFSVNNCNFSSIYQVFVECRTDIVGINRFIHIKMKVEVQNYQL